MFSAVELVKFVCHYLGYIELARNIQHVQEIEIVKLDVAVKWIVGPSRFSRYDVYTEGEGECEKNSQFVRHSVLIGCVNCRQKG